MLDGGANRVNMSSKLVSPEQYTGIKVGVKYMPGNPISCETTDIEIYCPYSSGRPLTVPNFFRKNPWYKTILQ